jgi:radical SAM protein with 4Fe4S-binding SPASM domain
MHTQNYADFSQGLHRRGVEKRLPLGGTIEVTRRCPLRCIHCYNNLPLGDRTALAAELTVEEHRRILDEMAEAGCLWLLYTGGEIFARDDFLDIYAYAKQKGFIITLFTNGTLITEEVADFLAEWRPFAVEVSLYGRTRQTYERVTGVAGSFRRCMRGIQLLRDRGLTMKLKTMVLTVNRHEIWELKRFVEEELGLEFRFDAMINPRIDSSSAPLSVRLNPREIVALDLQDSKRLAEWRTFGEKYNGPVHSPECWDEQYHCGGGISSFAIDPSGKLAPCVLSRGESWDLRQGSFREGWEEFLPKMRHKKITRQTKCLHCEIKALCGMCPANGELENSDAEEPVDFLCEVAHLRAEALGFPVKPHGECKYCKISGTPKNVSLLPDRHGKAIEENREFKIIETLSVPKTVHAEPVEA